MAKVLTITGTKKSDISLPPVFSVSYRPDLIKRAVLAAQANRRVPYGPNSKAGQRTTAITWHTGMGLSRVPRIKGGPKRSGRGRRGYRSKFRTAPASGRAGFIPGAVGGRRAHPPKPEKIYSQKMNEKERKTALKSAIAGTTNAELVTERGHILEKQELPLIIEDKFADMAKTKEIAAVFEKIGFSTEIKRVSKRRVRAGIGKMRGRRYKSKTGPLVVLHGDKHGRRIKNIPGVDICGVNSLNCEKLSPGAHSIRLTIFTESAIKEIGEKYK